MTFSPATYLTSQGWSGPGTPLQKGGIKKPVTVVHKTNLKGIGKERDTGYAWWDDVFSMVANKGKGVCLGLRDHAKQRLMDCGGPTGREIQEDVDWHPFSTPSDI